MLYVFFDVKGLVIIPRDRYICGTKKTDHHHLLCKVEFEPWCPNEVTGTGDPLDNSCWTFWDSEVCPVWSCVCGHRNANVTCQCHMSMSHANVTYQCHMSMSHANVTCQCHMSMSHVNVLFEHLFPKVKQHFATRNEMALIKVFLVRYFLAQPFDAQ